MTQSAQNSREVQKLLKEIESEGYGFKLPDRWGKKRAIKNLRWIKLAIEFKKTEARRVLEFLNQS